MQQVRYAVCVVIVVYNLTSRPPNAEPGPNYSTTRFSTTSSPTPANSVYYKNCDEAHADGRYSIPSSDPAYRPDLDLDGDGLACEPSNKRRSTR